MSSKKSPVKLLVMDIDNTVFDWVDYYVNAFGGLLSTVADTIKVPYATLAAQAKEVFAAHGSIEYPFAVQELPAVNEHYGDDIDRMLSECVDPSRVVFKALAVKHMVLYPGVAETLQQIRTAFRGMPIVALTDAPRYVAMWKLNKLGILPMFDAVYGLSDPRLPTSAKLGRVKVDARILLKHLQQNDFGFTGKIRILPDDYEKPGVRGLKTVLMDFDQDEPATKRQQVLWLGDNLRKDIGLGVRLGVKTAWAKYGANIPPPLLQKLHEFSPPLNIHKNANLTAEHPESPVADLVLESFSDIRKNL